MSSESSQTGFLAWVKHAIRLFFIAVAGMIVLILVLRTNLDFQRILPWIAFLAGTAVLFGKYLSNSAAEKKLKAFWTASGTALLIHCAIWVLIITSVHSFKPIWIIGMLAEYPALTSIRGFFSAQLG